MIHVKAKESPAVVYILDTVLKDWLGLSYQLIPSDIDGFKFASKSSEKTFDHPNILLQFLDSHYPFSFKVPEPIWFEPENEEAQRCLEGSLPVFLNSGDSVIEEWSDKGGKISFDILGSVFFFITRMEEYSHFESDNHDRFSSDQSILEIWNVLNRPIADEYVELLWYYLSNTFPDLKRTQRSGKVIPTCDVDRPLEVMMTWKNVIRHFAKDVLKSPMGAFKALNRRMSTLTGSYNKDEHLNNIRWMMSACEKEGLTVEFNFIADRSHPKLDGIYSINDAPIMHIIAEIHQRGHKIGIHPSYNTYLDKRQTKKEVDALNRLLSELKRNTKVKVGRQHFLRWRTPETLNNLIHAGVEEDSTMSFADKAGFRAGTSRVYNWYDLSKDGVTPLKEKPLIFMECTVIAERYMNMGYSEEAINYVLDLKRKSLKYNGNFVFLWHDYHFYSEKDKLFYQKMIAS